MAIQPAPVSSITVGDITVTFLSDGEARVVAAGMFPASTSDGWVEHRQWLDDDGRVVNSIGGFLVETGDRKLLVDLGFGANHVEIPDFAVFDGGRFLDSLSQTKVDAKDIDTVVYTHLHVDHTGWTSQVVGDARRLTFANANHVLAAAEHLHWQAPDETGVGPNPEVVLGPLDAHIDFAEDGQVIAPGVNVVATPGHTPGHLSVVISSGSERAMIMGDVLHCPAQLPEAEWGVLFDVDPALARKTRDQLLAEIEGTATIVGCSHFPDSVFGRVVRGNGKRYWQAAG